VKELTARLIQEAIDAELDEELGTASTTTRTNRTTTAVMAALKIF